MGYYVADIRALPKPAMGGRAMIALGAGALAGGLAALKFDSDGTVPSAPSFGYPIAAGAGGLALTLAITFGARPRSAAHAATIAGAALLSAGALGVTFERQQRQHRLDDADAAKHAAIVGAAATPSTAEPVARNAFEWQGDFSNFGKGFTQYDVQTGSVIGSDHGYATERDAWKVAEAYRADAHRGAYIVKGPSSYFVTGENYTYSGGVSDINDEQYTMIMNSMNIDGAKMDAPFVRGYLAGSGARYERGDDDKLHAAS